MTTTQDELRKEAEEWLIEHISKLGVISSDFALHTAKLIAVGAYQAGAQAARKWIAMSELPKRDVGARMSDEVLVVDEFSNQFVADYDFEEERWYCGSMVLDDVTHWQKLPAAPEKETP